MPGSDMTRKKIRDNIKSLLSGNTDAGTRVFTSRINKAFIEELPGIFIYTSSDTPQNTRKLENTFDRIVTVGIEVITAQKTEADVIQDEADTIAGQIEDLLLPNIHLQDPAPWAASPGPKIIDWISLGPFNMSRVDEIQEDLYGVVMQFECGYHYEKAEPTGLLEDFNKFGEDFETDDMTAERVVDIP